MKTDPKSFLPLTEATYLILASLTTPKHGYAIMQEVSALSGGAQKLGPGTLYGAITKLLDSDLIRRTGESDGGDERRKLYVLTALGRRVVESECARMEAMAGLGRKALAAKGEAR